MGQMPGRRARADAARIIAVLGVAMALTACGSPGPRPSGTSTGSAPSSASVNPTGTPAGTPTVSPSAAGSPTAASPTPRPRPSASPSCTDLPERLSLRGDRHHAFAFASLQDPGEVTVEGRVAGAAAWSTSKVLVVAAYLDTAVDGDPDRIGAADRRLITAALTRSDGDAVVAIRARVVGRPGAAMTAVLRSIGDTTTVAPEQAQGTMTWSIREQVRFMAALADGAVVSRAASAHLLRAMRPIPEHAWGLGRIGAQAYKGGWLRAGTATRQLGLVDGYAVAIITDVGPAVVQTDGDAAHVRELNRVAETLRDRLTYEQACG
jgi:hypothetical protein